jgi:nitrate reductase alpha subunit
MLVMCGCVGQSGGGWAHYVGQEKLRPQTGWTPLAFALDWARPPRQHELDLGLLRPHRPVALRDAEGRNPVADRA